MSTHANRTEANTLQQANGVMGAGSQTTEISEPGFTSVEFPRGPETLAALSFPAAHQFRTSRVSHWGMLCALGLASLALPTSKVSAMQNGSAAGDTPENASRAANVTHAPQNPAPDNKFVSDDMAVNKEIGSHEFKYRDSSGRAWGFEMPIEEASGPIPFSYRTPFPLLQPEGSDSVVWSRVEQDSCVLYQFGVVLDCPEFKETAREIISEYKPDAKNPRAAQWPMTDAFVIAVDPRNRADVLAEEYLPGLLKYSHYYFHLKVAREDVPRFEELLKSGDLELNWRYRSRDAKYARGESNLVGSFDISQELQSSFSSEQLAGHAPITRSQYEGFAKKVRAKIRREIVCDDPAVMQLLDLQGPEKLLAGLITYEQKLTLDELKGRHPEVEASLAQFLSPHLQRFKEACAKDDITINLSQDVSQKGKSSGFGFGVGPFKFGSSKSKFEGHLKQLEQSTGTHFERSDEGTSFAAHAFTGHFVVSGSQTVHFDDQTLVKLRIMNEGSRFIDSGPIPISFTYKVVQEALQREERQRQRLEYLEKMLQRFAEWSQREIESKEELERNLSITLAQLEAIRAELTAATGERDGLKGRVQELENHIAQITRPPPPPPPRPERAEPRQRINDP